MIRFFKLKLEQLMLKARRSPRLMRVLRTFYTEEGNPYPKHVWVIPGKDAGKFDPKQIPLFGDAAPPSTEPYQMDLFDEAEAAEQLAELKRKKNTVLVVEIPKQPAQVEKPAESTPAPVPDDIPEKLKDKPPKLVEYKIISKGRKWFKGKVPGKSYEVEIAINEASKDFEIGKKVSFMALVDDQHSRYGSKTVVYPVGARPPQESDRAAAAERIKAANSAAYMQQAEKWLGYIKENLSKYWYKRGEEEVRAVAKKMEAAGLDPKDLLAKLSSLQEKWKGISTSESTLKKEANRWLGFIEDSLAQYWYKKGESEVRGIIKKMEAAGYDASETQKKLSDLQAKWDKKTGKKSTDGALAPGEVYLSAGSGNGGERFHVGDVIKNPHSGGATYLKILSEKSKYYAEDGLSFGVGDDSGYIYTATARPATDEESAPLREEEQAAAEQRAYKEKLQEIARDIREHGERPENAKPEGEKVYLSEQDERSVIYGGGQWLVVGSEWIWFVQNNGMDGDNWGANNIGGTGGSGAIGWRVPTTPELVDSIGVQPPVVKKRQW